MDYDILLSSNRLILFSLALQYYDRLLDLNMIIAKIFFELNEWICPPPVLLEKFLEFLENGRFGYIHLKSPNESLIKLKIIVILYLNLTGIVNMQFRLVGLHSPVRLSGKSI